MVSELLGEMNVSHTGCYYSAAAAADGGRHGLAGPVHGLRFRRARPQGGRDPRRRPAGQGRPQDPGRPRHREDRRPGPGPRRSTTTGSSTARPASSTLLSVLDPATGSRWEEAVKPDLRGRGERPALPALGRQPPGRGRPPVRRPPRLRPRPEHERRQLPDGHRGGPRAEPGQGGPDRRHPLQRRRQPPRHPGRFPERQEGLRHRAPRPARRLRAATTSGSSRPSS